jgi:hypothetical protein
MDRSKIVQKCGLSGGRARQALITGPTEGSLQMIGKLPLLARTNNV